MKYINTLQELRDVSLKDLGPMNEGSYNYFKEEAEKFGIKHDIRYPKLIIDVKYKPDAHTFLKETAYPISHLEWDQTIKDIDTLLEQIPHVHIVDGDVYTAPI